MGRRAREMGRRAREMGRAREMVRSSGVRQSKITNGSVLAGLGEKWLCKRDGQIGQVNPFPPRGFPSTSSKIIKRNKSTAHHTTSPLAASLASDTKAVDLRQVYESHIPVRSANLPSSPRRCIPCQATGKHHHKCPKSSHRLLRGLPA